nr:hypothetical protein [Acidobacteriota bacterium]
SLLASALSPASAGPPAIPACPAPHYALPPGVAPPPADDPEVDGPWLDCYSSCVDAQWKRCVEQCGSYDPMINPCLAICYDAISIGCAIGCSRLTLQQQTIGASPF